VAMSPPFGDLLRQYRLAAGLTQEVLAEKAGLSVPGISDLERGVRRIPRRDTIERLAAALQLTAQERAALAGAARAARARLGARRIAPPGAAPGVGQTTRIGVLAPPLAAMEEAVRAALGAEAFDRLWAAGQIMPFEQAVAEALAVGGAR
jgi:transcriptional regulator with XRE-family HTH domain